MAAQATPVFIVTGITSPAAKITCDEHVFAAVDFALHFLAPCAATITALPDGLAVRSFDVEASTEATGNFHLGFSGIVCDEIRIDLPDGNNTDRLLVTQVASPACGAGRNRSPRAPMRFLKHCRTPRSLSRACSSTPRRVRLVQAQAFVEGGRLAARGVEQPAAGPV